MRIARYRSELTELPVDLFADPDGVWDYDSLVVAAGFDPSAPGISVAALTEPFDGHPDGSAVVACDGCEYIAVIECIAEPIALPVQRRSGPPRSVPALAPAARAA